MQRHFTKREGRGGRLLLAGLLSVSLALALTGRAAAQFSLRMPPWQPFSGRMAVARQPGGPNTPWQTLGAINVQPILNAFMGVYRPQAEDMLTAELGKPGRWQGQTAYNIDVRLADRGQLYAQDLNADLRYMLPNNSVAFNMTTPTVFGKSLDPRFVITFDLVVTLSVSLDSLQVNGVQVSVQNAHIQGANLTGDLATAVSDVSGFLGGPDFRKSLEARIDMQTQMAALNVGLRNLGLAIPPGLSVRPFLDDRGQTLTLVVQEPPAGGRVILH